MAAPINLTNQFLIAMPGMGEGTFSGTVVFLCEHNEKGALGLVMNRPIEITLESLFKQVELSLDLDASPSCRCISAARCRPSAASSCTSRPVRARG